MVYLYWNQWGNYKLVVPNERMRFMRQEAGRLSDSFDYLLMPHGVFVCIVQLQSRLHSMPAALSFDAVCCIGL